MNHLKVGRVALKWLTSLTGEPLHSHRTAALRGPLRPLQAECRGWRQAQFGTGQGQAGEEVGPGPTEAAEPRTLAAVLGPAPRPPCESPSPFTPTQTYNPAEKISTFSEFSCFSLQKNCHCGLC